MGDLFPNQFIAAAVPDYEALYFQRCAERDALASRVERLEAALAHMKWCRSCAEGDWSDCEQGKKALELLEGK